MLSSKEAAQIARENGLTLADAAALGKLCSTVEEAREAAAMFAPSAGPPQLSRAALQGMTSDQIVAVHDAGQLRDLMSGKVVE
jgi:hypothetical protein